jgi:MYXO-CTERM domain-containing protein
MPAMATPVHAHFSDSWWADCGADEDRRPGGLGLWALIVLLALSPGVGVLLTVLLD